ncbi:MAG TPA: BTAD domain-containing putative transcriptional regulator [Streptosporangiaceae bacterium]|nr:BTAD domain-containing putative transcriptional regulator [Streptosporangiaceae bacterium]
MQVRLLGPVDVMVGGAPKTVPGLRRRAVLATLALRAGEVVGTDQLVDAVWGASVPSTAANTLQSHVSYLRHVLPGKSVIVARPPGYVLELGDSGTDVQVAERLLRQSTLADNPAEGVQQLKEAAGLWRGRSLANVTGLVWLEGQAERLDVLQLTIKRALTQARLAIGEHAQLLPELEELAAEHPLDEQIRAQLMLALYRCGRQADALATFGRLRRELDDKLGLEPSQLLRDMEISILRQDPSLDMAAQLHAPDPAAASASRAAPASARSSWLTPAQLPSSVAGFAGRSAELLALETIREEGATDGTVTISAVSGTAGVGKTALAVYWAHQVAKHYPDGQLFVNLHGFGPDGAAVSPATAVRGFLDALGVPPAQIPDGLQAQAALYRSLLAGLRALVVIDNARDADQVRPLLPGSPGCLAIVTSRHQLTGLVATDGARPLALDLLCDDEARDLLARRLGKARIASDPLAVEEIVTGCARLPLALSIAAARAATTPGFPLAAVATELREAGCALDPFDGGDHATDVRAVFSWSYHALSPEGAGLFRLLGLYPGCDITAPAIASLAGLEVDRIRVLLAELTRANLLTEYRPFWYSIHDLLRAYAMELLTEHDTEETCRQALSRMLGHYLHTSHSAVVLMEPYFNSLRLPPPPDGVTLTALSSARDAQNWFATEHATLLAAVHLAAEAGFDTVTWQLAWAQSMFLLRNGSWNEQLMVQRMGLDAARRVGDLAGEAHLLHRLASGYQMAGRIDEADELFRQALRQFQLIDDPANQAVILSSMTVLAGRRNRPEDALKYSLRAHDLFRLSGHRAGQALVLNDIGYAHALIGNYQQALTYCHRALRATRELDERSWEAATWDSLGYIHHKLGDDRRAISCYQRAKERYQERADRYNEADALVSLGDVWQATGQTETACEAWRQALAIFDEIGHPDREGVQARLAEVVLEPHAC